MWWLSVVCATVAKVPLRARFWIFTTRPSWAGSTVPDIRSSDPCARSCGCGTRSATATFIVAIALVVAGVVVALTSNCVVTWAAVNGKAKVPSLLLITEFPTLAKAAVKGNGRPSRVTVAPGAPVPTS